MLTWLKELFKDWNAVQKELSDMGIFNSHGYFCYLDQEQLNKYLDDKQSTVQRDDTKT
jgi:hypothetical protein